MTVVVETRSPSTSSLGPGARGRVAPTIAIVATLVLWQLAVTVGLIDAQYFPDMVSTVTQLAGLVVSSSFWLALADTLMGAALGMAWAVALGIPLGVLFGSTEWLYRAFRVPIEFLRPMPSVALIPVAVLVFGTGLEGKVFLAAFAAFWPLFVQTVYGMHDTDSVVVETARSYRVRTFDRLWRIKLPGALPFIMTGARISAAVALILAVTAELLFSQSGLGYEINLARSSGAISLMYALIIAAGFLGLLLNAVMVFIEQRVLSWHPSTRELLP
ncbi:ABC transporter permease [Microbacterium album]|uniref:Aliphatic sulfonates transporter permease n=1 Tax=Microbacterium album TaxID=2053191 RepID=A0A917IF95_9MICO|nr:ABC transporter permease [Microbacterium album]GGH47341.1 aliphatic sulfonates transporter permease [Microbacterium album]